MEEQKSKATISASLLSDGTITAASSDAICPYQRIAQDFLLIWVYTSMDFSTEDYQNTLAQLRSVFNHLIVFTEPDECMDFLSDLNDIRAFLIIGDIDGTGTGDRPFRSSPVQSGPVRYRAGFRTGRSAVRPVIRRRTDRLPFDRSDR